MKVTISFKHQKHSPEVDQRLQEKSQKLDKYLGGKTTLKWTCYKKENYTYTEAVLFGSNFEYHAKSYADNLFHAFDATIAKLEKQLCRKKDKIKNKIHKKNPELTILDPEMAWAEYDEDYVYEKAS